MHLGVEITESSTNKQHHLSLALSLFSGEPRCFLTFFCSIPGNATRGWEEEEEEGGGGGGGINQSNIAINEVDAGRDSATPQEGEKGELVDVLRSDHPRTHSLSHYQ